MNKRILSVIIIFLPLIANAYDVEIDGIYYYLNTETKEAEITYNENNGDDYSGDVVIPEKILYNETEYTVTSIGARAFSKCKNVSSIIIPNSVTRIKVSAFQNCRGLTSIVIPKSVTTINDKVFHNCTNLTSITIPSSVTSFSTANFYGCSSLSKIIVDNVDFWVNYICDKGRLVDDVDNNEFHLYVGDNEVTEITIPNSFTSIKEGTFQNYVSIESVSIGESVTNIGNSAFYGCCSLKSVTIPNSVTSISGSTFVLCI